MIPAMDAKTRRLVAWILGIGVVLLVTGYLTAEQWLALVSGVL